MNGTVRDFANVGIAASANSKGVRILGIRAVNNGAEGIYLYGDMHVVIQSAAIFNSGDGITVDSGSLVSESISSNNGGYGISASGGSAVKDCTVNNNSKAGISASASTITNNSVSGNNTSDLAGGYAGIDVGESTVVQGNTVSRNRDWGISTYGVGSVVKDNVVSSNNLDGVSNQGGIRLSEKGAALLKRQQFLKIPSVIELSIGQS